MDYEGRASTEGSQELRLGEQISLVARLDTVFAKPFFSEGLDVLHNKESYMLGQVPSVSQMNIAGFWPRTCHTDN